jgi:hypothetical protein
VRVALYKEKIELAVQVIDKFAPGLPEAERLMYINRLVKLLNILSDSRLEIE